MTAALTWTLALLPLLHQEDPARKADIAVDVRLAILEDLLERGVTTGIRAQLPTTDEGKMTPSRQAELTFLAGLLELLEGNEPEAMTRFLAVVKVHADQPACAKALYYLGRIHETRGEEETAKQLWESVGQRFPQSPFADRALIALTGLLNKRQTPEQQYAARRTLVEKITDVNARGELLLSLADLRRRIAGVPTPEEVDWLVSVIVKHPDARHAEQAWERLRNIPEASASAGPLERIAAAAPDLEKRPAVRKGNGALLRIRCAVRAAALSRAPDDERRLLAQARELIDAARKNGDLALYATALEQLGAETFLVEAEKAAERQNVLAALPALRSAADIEVRLARQGEVESINHLFRIARLLEHLNEWRSAIDLYQTIFTALPVHPRAEEALRRIPVILDQKMADPLGAVRACKRYTAFFPPPDRVSISGVLERMKRLGYSSIIEFQTAVGVKNDGLIGPDTLARLDEMEQVFREILPPAAKTAEVRGGAYVHDAIFKIADTLRAQGRYREAILAYEEFVNLFPSKHLADEALYRIGGMFQESFLFEEAMGAYRRLMADYPKGDVTSEAYPRTAECLENLGRWAEADEICALYIKKFPKYPGVPDATARRESLAKLQRYQEFLNAFPDSPRVPDALYEMGRILYKERKNLVRAATVFAEIPDRFSKHYHAPEARFTEGVTQLHAQHYSRARRAFADLVAKFPESRLADDGQFWIGHTYEYEARAIGELDRHRITLKRRVAGEQEQLQGDLALRQRYLPTGQTAAPIPAGSPWSDNGEATQFTGAIHERTNRLLLDAIAAYGKTAEEFKTGDMADRALARIGAIYTEYLDDPEKGVAAYGKLLANYPGSKEAVDAQYQVGMHYQKTGKHAEAVKALELFTFHYANDPRVGDALLAMADCWTKQKEWLKAIDAYESYLNKFPDGPRAPFAREQIEWIKKYHF